MTLTPMATAPAASGPDDTARLPRRRLTMRERREAFAQHRKEMTRLILAKADWVPVLVFVSIFMTPEARLDLSGFALYPYRLALIASLPFIAIRWSRNPLRIGTADVLILGSAVWMFVATAAHYPMDVALKTGGANTFDTAAAYLLGRVFFRCPLDLRRFLYRVSPLVFAAGLLLMVESISHRYILRPLVGTITGHSPAAILARTFEIRNGLLRAVGPFLHPIAAGLFCASLVPLYMSADLPRRRWLGLTGAIGGIFSMSSAGLGTITVALSLGVYDYIQRRNRIGWSPVILTALAFCIATELFTSSGLVKFVIRYAALNPQTGYFRLAIWDYGFADVMRHPWFGIGYFETYDRPRWMRTDSVDNYWLLIALRYGFPCLILTLSGVVAAVFSIGRARQMPELGGLHGYRMATGICVSLVLIYVSLISVAPWGADMAWLTILVGMAAGLADRLSGRMPDNS